MEKGIEDEIDHGTDTADATAHAHETEGAETGRGMTSALALLWPFANANTAHAQPPLPDRRRQNAAAVAAQDHDHGPRTSAIRNLCPTRRSPFVASTTPARHLRSMVVRLSTRRSPTLRRLVRLRSMPIVLREPRFRSSTMSLRRRANRPRRSHGAYSYSKAMM